MSRRPSVEDTFIELAVAWAKRSTCTARGSVGCVLVDRNNRVVASGYNGAPRGLPHCDDVGCTLDSDGHCIGSIHAETNAIIQCAITGVSTQGTTLYTTSSPCARCAINIVQAGIMKVVFVKEYRFETDFQFAAELFRGTGITFNRYVRSSGHVINAEWWKDVPKEYEE